MVCPITEPWHNGLSTREIWLPDGIWTDIFTGEVLVGGHHRVTRDCKSIPVFAKAGAIIPMQKVAGNFCGNPEHLILNVYNNANGSYTLYEDDGESTDYTKGVGAHTRFEVEGNVFRIHPAEGDLTSLPAERTYTVCFKAGCSAADAFINGEKADCNVADNTVTISNIKPTDCIEIKLN